MYTVLFIRVYITRTKTVFSQTLCMIIPFHFSKRMFYSLILEQVSSALKNIYIFQKGINIS